MRRQTPGANAVRADRVRRSTPLPRRVRCRRTRHGTPASTGAEPARTHRVVIHGLKYEPETLVVRRGDTVVWVNEDPMPHTVTAAGGFDSRTIEAGKSWRFVARRAGRLSLRLHAALEHGRLASGRVTALPQQRLVPLVLPGAEQDLARLVVAQRLAQSGEDLDAALHRRARGDAIEPGLGVREVAPVDALVLP